jgi:hypothetical protein
MGDCLGNQGEVGVGADEAILPYPRINEVWEVAVGKSLLKLSDTRYLTIAPVLLD